MLTKQTDEQTTILKITYDRKKEDEHEKQMNENQQVNEKNI